MGQYRGGCFWLGTTQLALFLIGSLCSRHWTGHRGKNNPCPPSLHHLKRRKTVQAANWHHVPRRAVPRRATPEGPLTKGDTNQAGQDLCCLSITEACCTQRQKNKIIIYRAIHMITSKLHTEEMSWIKRTLADPRTWHPNKLNAVRRMENGRGSLGQLTWSNLFTSLDNRLTIWPVVVFPMAELLKRRAWNERETELDFCGDTKSLLEHNTTEHILMGSWAMSG